MRNQNIGACNLLTAEQINYVAISIENYF